MHEYERLKVVAPNTLLYSITNLGLKQFMQCAPSGVNRARGPESLFQLLLPDLPCNCPTSHSSQMHTSK